MAASRHADTPRKDEPVTTQQAPHTPLPWMRTNASFRAVRMRRHGAYSVRTSFGHCSEPGFLDHAKCVRRLRHSTEFGQVMTFGCGVCKTVGSAYVGSNPTPATISGNAL